ncbi:MAG: HEAT repeat domain-containing protein [Deltaproteobacteria bacterium]|nr:HEAT repeat domain-containing protein [Deltaproteobacteria bacterium]
MARAIDRSRVLLYGTCLALGALAAAGWMREITGEISRPIDSDEQASEMRGRFQRSDPAERIRLIRRLGRSGGVRAAGLLSEALQTSSDPRLRLTAIRQLGLAGGPAAVKQLRALLADGAPAAERYAAIHALGQVRSDQAVEGLIARLESHGETKERSYLLEALAESHHADAAKVLASLADAGELAAIRSLGALGGSEALASLLKLSEHRAASIRLAAIEALGRTADPNAKRRLLDLIRRSDRASRLQAVRALKSFASDDVQVLLSQLAQSKDNALSIAAIEALSDGPLSRQTLLNLLADGSLTARRRALDALGRSDDPTTHPAIAKLLFHPMLADDAARALANSVHPSARELLLNTVDGQSPLMTQRAIVLQLNQLSGPDVEQALTRLLATGAPGIQSSALTRLVALRGEAARPQVLSAHRNGARQLRQQALALLAQWASKDDLPLFVSSLNAGDYSEVQTALRAIKAIGGKRAEEAIFNVIENGGQISKAAAIATLAEVGGDRARKVLLAQITAKDHAGTYNAEWALGKLADPKAREELLAILDDDRQPARVKQRAMRALSYYNDPRTFTELARHKDQTIARTALSYLGRAGGREAEEILIERLRSDDGVSRYGAFSALRQLATPTAVEAIAGRFDQETAAEASNALAQIGSRRAFDVLEDRYSRGDKATQLAVIGALNANQGESAKKLLYAALNSQEKDVVIRAVYQLGQAHDPDVEQRLLNLLSTTDDANIRRTVGSKLRYRATLYANNKQLIDAAYYGRRL